MRGTQSRHAACGVSRLGEDAEVLRIHELRHLECCERDRPALGAGLGRERLDALQAVLLGRIDDARHRLHDDDRVLAHARLTREHDRVGAVQDGVGDVAGLGARGNRVVDHRLEHLRRDDDGLGHAAAEFDGALLHDRNGFQRQFDAQIAAGDHDSVECVDDLLEVVDGLRLLDLGDDGDVTPLLGHDHVHALHVLGAAHERQGDQVGADAQTPAEVGLVLLGQRGNGDRDAGKVDALVVGDGAGDDDLGRDHDAVGLDDLDLDLAVVDQEVVARLDVVREALERRRDDLLGAGDVLGGDLEDVADREIVGAVGELAEADLGSLQVDEHGDGAAGILRGFANVGEARLVNGVIAVAEVHARDVDTRLDDRPHLLVRGGGGSQGGDDLGASHRCLCSGWFVGGLAKGPRPAYAGCRPIATSVGRTGAGSAVSPIRYSSTCAAAARPSAIAHTMSDCPRPASPATKTPGAVVW